MAKPPRPLLMRRALLRRGVVPVVAPRLDAAQAVGLSLRAKAAGDAKRSPVRLRSPSQVAHGERPAFELARLLHGLGELGDQARRRFLAQWNAAHHAERRSIPAGPWFEPRSGRHEAQVPGDPVLLAPLLAFSAGRSPAPRAAGPSFLHQEIDAPLTSVVMPDAWPVRSSGQAFQARHTSTPRVRQRTDSQPPRPPVSSGWRRPTRSEHGHDPR